MSETPDPVLPLASERLEVKAVLLLGFIFALIVASALYVMYARGLFDSTQKLVLVSEDSEGVVVGMNLTFSGFPIGRVRRIELDGEARPALWSTWPARTPTGCASRVCLPWCAGWWAAPTFAPTPGC